MFRLTDQQKASYKENGYLVGLPPVFDSKELMAGYERLTGSLMEGEIASDMINWHRTSRWLYDLCTHPQILDIVEDILGPDFVLWATDFITKSPNSEKIVPWHQDAYYWPLHPHNTVTVWMAFTDVDEGNAAMKVIPGTHRGGVIKHKIADESSILSFELDDGAYREDTAVSLPIPAGGFSLHDDAVIHGSPANLSDRWRIGFVARYSGTNVKCDLTKTPHYLAYLVRGKDEFKHNPMGVPPTEAYARPPYHRRIRKTAMDGNN
ncbi:MAG: phytanoyl-CoA dioxygenase family protein [Cohnella sp.]|nr:phytanoyl-CoA dioxygenase family protein [Cohnella sp.]